MNIELLKVSWEELQPYRDEAAQHFCAHLFQNHPEMRFLFDEEQLPDHCQTLMSTLARVVEDISDDAKLISYLREIGAQHAAYGAQPAHYEQACESLIATLAHYFDTTWSPELEQTWRAVLRRCVEILFAPPAESQQEGLAGEVDDMLRALVGKAMNEILSDNETVSFARQKARAILHNALIAEISELKSQLTSNRAA